MALTKRMLDEQNEQNAPINCPNCKINYDDKFIDYCPKHLAEMDNYERAMADCENYGFGY